MKGMGAYDTPSANCPYCGSECEADWVDVGVGMVQCGPYHCDCGASEIGPEKYDWAEGPKDKYGQVEAIYDNGVLRMKKGHPFSERELDTNWYEPEKQTFSPYANMVGGVLVDHVTAKEAYNVGLLDEKVLPQAIDPTESAQAKPEADTGGTHD